MNNLNKRDFQHCPICNSSKIEIHIPLKHKSSSPKIWPKMTGDIGIWTFNECKECSHIFVDPEHYNKHDYINREANPSIHSHFFNVQPSYISLFLKEIYKRTGKRKLRILDFGCAYGVKAKLIAEHGHEVIGYDIAKEHTIFASDRYNIKTFTGEWEQVKDLIGKVDVVFSEHVFEHIPHPLSTLLSLREILKDNGIIYISIPNFYSKQVGYLPPEHLHYFNNNSIHALAKSAAFQPLAHYEGLPLINILHKYTNKLLPLPVIHVISNVTASMGLYGYSLFIYAIKLP